MGNQKYGVTLPNYGPHASVSTLIEATHKVEEHGLDSVIFPDHLMWHPHTQTNVNDRTFIEVFTVLSALSSVTDKIQLVTGVTIPIRHPLILAHLYSSVDWLSNGRVIAGLGAGSYRHEFDIIDVPFENRTQLGKESMEILKLVWTEDEVDYDGEIFSFHDVTILPKPQDEIPIWYGGSSPASIRRTINYADGWFPGRINIKTFKAGVEKLERMAKEKGRPRPTVAALPITYIDENREKARKEADVGHFLELANSNEFDYWIKPNSGRFETLEDLEGVVMAGNPEDIVYEAEKYLNNGVDHLVFDIRMQLDKLDYTLDLICEQVLPELP